MNLARGFIVLLLVGSLLNACTTKPEKEGARVICPACGTDFGAIYHKRF